MRPNRSSSAALFAALAATLGTFATLSVRPALAAEPGPTLEPAVPAETTPDPAEALSGEAIYDLVLSNRFDSFDQSLVLISGDRGGNTETTKMDVKYLYL